MSNLQRLMIFLLGLTIISLLMIFAFSIFIIALILAPIFYIYSKFKGKSKPQQFDEASAKTKNSNIIDADYEVIDDEKK